MPEIWYSNTTNGYIILNSSISIFSSKIFLYYKTLKSNNVQSPFTWDNWLHWQVAVAWTGCATKVTPSFFTFKREKASCTTTNIFKSTFSEINTETLQIEYLTIKTNLMHTKIWILITSQIKRNMVVLKILLLFWIYIEYMLISKQK